MNNLMDLLLISDLFISSFGLSMIISNQLYACLLPLHTTIIVLLVYGLYSEC